MPYSRYNAKRGGIIRLDAKFYQNDTLTQPYSHGSMTVDVLASDDSYLTGKFNGSATNIALSGLSPSTLVTGHYYYDLQTPSGLTVGIYRDRWNGIQYTEGSDVFSGVYSFNVLYNDSDSADWTTLPG